MIKRRKLMLMSSGSYFLILKDTEKVLSKEDLYSRNFKLASKMEYSLLKKPETKEEIEYNISRLQDTQVYLDKNDDEEEIYFSEHEDWYSISSGKIYKALTIIPFLSDFNCLKDHFDMNPYTPNGEISLSYLDVYKMREALIYIKGSNFWSKTIEEFLLDKNEYIRVFDELSSNFMERFSDSKEWSYYLDDWAIDKLILLFNSFMLNSNCSESEIKLVYKTY